MLKLVISLERQTFQQFQFVKLITAIKSISVVSEEMRLVDKYLENIMIPFFWTDCVRKWEINAELLACFCAQ
jgi:hypothetical protein